jgi:hypothetical protein
MASCVNRDGTPKVKHIDKGSARRHAHSVRKHQLHDVREYRCPKCGYWHVGRIPMYVKLRQEFRRRDAVDERLVGQLIGALIKVLRK